MYIVQESRGVIATYPHSRPHAAAVYIRAVLLPALPGCCPTRANAGTTGAVARARAFV